MLEYLETKIAFNAISDQEYDIIAAGPMTIQPGTMPYRVILIQTGTKFCLCTQSFDENVQLDRLHCSKSYLSNGSYYGLDQFCNAAEDFGNKIANHARNHYESIYRNAPQTA